MTLQDKIQKKAEGYGKLAPAFLEGAEFALNNQWISVDDDLPCNHEELIIDDELLDKHTKPVICNKSYGVSCVGIMIYNVDRNAWHWVSEKPTHWFPIPELPKEKGDKIMERKIGEIFNVHGTFLQVWEAKESDGCNGCFFEEYRPLCLPYKCTAQEREDGKNVQFKQISKTMTTEEAKRRAELYSALAEGKTIQVQNPNGKWEDLKIEGLDHLYDCNKYRIKPEIKYRPFKSQEECWQEMHKHPDFGWVAAQDSKVIYHINIVGDGYIHIDGSSIVFSTAYSEYEFLDGTPFGVKEEE